MPPRASDARQQTILDAALAIVDADGLDALTISALTARSGASNGSIYHHFGNRGGIIRALYADSLRHCVAALVPAFDTRPAAQVIPDLVHRYLTWVATNQARARFIYAASLSADARHDDVRDGKAATFAPLDAWYARQAAAGEVRPMPLWAFDAIAMGPAHECARRFLADPSFDLDAAGPAAAYAAWATARPEPTS
nr:TetR/AcrR family transcriptional regulator [Micromonospora sp. DSM 115978]